MMKGFRKASLLLPVVFIMLAAFVVSVQAAGSITRTISPVAVQPGGTITVTLTVDIDAERFYIIEEVPPSGLGILGVGDLVRDPNDHLKLVVVQGAVDKTYSYALQAPNSEGTFTFSEGIYSMDGMDDPVAIAGQSTITVSSAATGIDSNLLIIIIVIIIIVIAVFLYMKKQTMA